MAPSRIVLVHISDKNNEVPSKKKTVCCNIDGTEAHRAFLSVFATTEAYFRLIQILVYVARLLLYLMSR